MVRLFFASLLLSASALPALAAEACRTQGQAAAVEVPVAAANDAATLARAQMTLDALDPETTSQVPRTVSCSRGAINVDGTVYTIGGENGDPFPRTAAASGGSSTAYLYAVPGSAIGAATAYVLAVSDGSGSASAKTIFNGIPADAALTEAFRQALGPKAPIVSYDAGQHRNIYGAQIAAAPHAPAPPAAPAPTPAAASVPAPAPAPAPAPVPAPTPAPPAPPAPPPPPPPPTPSASAPVRTAPPPVPIPAPVPAPAPAPAATAPAEPPKFQVLMDGGPGRQFMDIPPGNHHRPSNFTCPLIIAGAVVHLNRITPEEDSLSCQYVPGQETVSDPILAPRYQLTLSLAAEANLPAAIERFGGATRERNPGARVHPSPAPPIGLYVQSTLLDTTDGRTVGVWVGKAGNWLAVLRVDYPAGAQTDQEAEAVVSQLFTAFYAEVGISAALPAIPR